MTSNAISLGCDAGGQVRLVERLTPLTVTGSPALAARDAVARQADDALDQVLAGVLRGSRPTKVRPTSTAPGSQPGSRGRVGRQPAARVLEDDDVAAVQVERPGRRAW